MPGARSLARIAPTPAAWSFPHAPRRDRDTGLAQHVRGRPPDHPPGRPADRCPDITAERSAQAGRRHPRAERGEGRQAPPGTAGPAAGVRRGGARAGATGREIRSVVVTLPDNPTGRLPRPATVRAFCEVAAEHDLIIISDEIYRDLVHDPAMPVLSPAAVAPQRTVVTTALSKNLALGGWRIGVAPAPG